MMDRAPGSGRKLDYRMYCGSFVAAKIDLYSKVAKWPLQQGLYCNRLEQD